MRVHVEVSGGIGGLRLGGTVDTGTLPPDVGDLVAAALVPDRLAAAAAPASDAAPEGAGEPVPDERQWRVTLGAETFDVAETRLDPDQVEALDALTAALVRDRRGRDG